MTGMLRWCERIRKGSLLMVVGAIPLAMAPQVLFQPTNPPKLAVLVLGVTVALAARILEASVGRGPGAMKPALVPVLAITLPLLVGWALGLHRSWALFGIHPRYLGLVPYLLFAVFALLLVESFRADPRPLAWALISSAGLAGAYTILQAFALEPFVWPAESKVLGLVRSSSTFGNPNFSGAFFAVSLPVGLALALWDRGRRDIAWVLTGLIASGWFVSFSQGPWLAGVAGLLVVAAVALKPRIGKTRLLAWVGIAGLSLVASGAVVATMMSQQAVDRLGSTVQSRSWAWETAVTMFTERPLTGWGPNVYAAEGIRFRPPEEARVAYWIAEDPHNFALSQTVSGGLLGLGGFIVLVVWVVRRVNRVIDSGHLAAAGFGGGAIAYLVQGLVSIDEVGVRLAAWVALGGLAIATVPSVPDPSLGARKRHLLPPSAAVAAVLLASGTWWAAGSVRTEADVLTGYRAAQDNDPSRSITYFERALSFRDNYDYRNLFGVKVGELGTRRGPAGAPYIEKMRDAYSYLDHFPDVGGLIEQARLLVAWGDRADPAAYQEALSLYERAAELDPHHPLIAVETSDALRGLRRFEEAVALLKRFELWDPPQASFYGALALTYAQMGNEPAARRYAETALRINGNDSRALLALEAIANDQS